MDFWFRRYLDLKIRKVWHPSAEEYIWDDDSADDELIESELSSEDDFEVQDVNAPDENCEKKKQIEK